MGGFAGAVEVAEGGEGQGEDGEVGEGEEEGEPVHDVGMGIVVWYDLILVVGVGVFISFSIDEEVGRS